METKLKSVSRNLTLRLAFKASIFGVLLYLAKISNFGFLPVLFFLVAAVLLYSRPLFRTFDFILPFMVLLALSIISAKALEDSSYFIYADLFFSFLFFLILGVKDLALIQRSAWHKFLNLSLVYSVLLLFFYYNQEFFFAKLIFLFFVILLLLKDLFKKRIFYWLIAFLLIEAIWAIGLLPIGFISAATLAVLIYYVLTDLASHALGGTLTRRRILIDVSIFIPLFLIVLAFSKWGI